MDLQRFFTEHPASVGETYWEHLLRASWFSGKLVCAAGACFVHAILPFMFVKTGSRAITQLYGAMVTNRSATPKELDLAPHGQFRVAK